MTNEPKALEERIQIGLGPQGIVVSVTDEGDIAGGTTLSPDEAYVIAGQLQSSATILIHTHYAALSRQRIEEEQFLAKTKGGKLWTPES